MHKHIFMTPGVVAHGMNGHAPHGFPLDNASRTRRNRPDSGTCHHVTIAMMLHMVNEPQPYIG